MWLSSSFYILYYIQEKLGFPASNGSSCQPQSLLLFTVMNPGIEVIATTTQSSDVFSCCDEDRRRANQRISTTPSNHISVGKTTFTRCIYSQLGIPIKSSKSPPHFMIGKLQNWKKVSNWWSWHPKIWLQHLTSSVIVYEAIFLQDRNCSDKDIGKYWSWTLKEGWTPMWDMLITVKSSILVLSYCTYNKQVPGSRFDGFRSATGCGVWARLKW